MHRNFVQIEKLRLGGLRRIELYGNPGTPQGRRKGGKVTTEFFHRNPCLARKAGFVIRKEINYPRHSNELAEFIGIMLGDGGMPGNHQLTITFNKKEDEEYVKYICSILKKLFSVNYFIRKRKDSNGADIVVSSSNLVEFLLKEGLIAGNKIRNQIDVPTWIYKRIEYQKSCLRGLIDTDGGLYLHRYYSNGKKYGYLKLCFTSYSKPLLRSVLNILKNLNFKAYLNGKHISIYSTSEVKRYFKEVSFRNPKNIKKFEEHFGY